MIWHELLRSEGMYGKHLTTHNTPINTVTHRNKRDKRVSLLKKTRGLKITHIDAQLCGSEVQVSKVYPRQQPTHLDGAQATWPTT